MKRMLPLSIAAVLALVCGCQKAKPEAHTEEPYSSSYSADTYTTGGDSSLDSLDNTDSYGDATPAASDTSYDQPLTPSSSGNVYVVKKGDTLYKLARQFYNDQSKWRDIWNANQTRVPNPDKLPVGTKLIIP